jgi:hypothetical protein
MVVSLTAVTEKVTMPNNGALWLWGCSVMIGGGPAKHGFASSIPSKNSHLTHFGGLMFRKVYTDSRN